MIRGHSIHLAPTIQGTLFVLLASIGYGLNPLFVRWASESGLSPESAFLYRALVPALLAIPWLAGSHKLPKPALTAVLLGMFIATGTLTYFRAITIVPVATAALVYFTYPLFTISLGWLFFRRRLTKKRILSSILIISASALILSPKSLAPHQLSALVVSFLMPISFAAILLGLEYCLPTLKSRQFLALGLWGQVLVIVPVMVWQPFPRLLPLLPLGWIAIIGLICLTSLIPQFFTIRGTGLLGAEKTAVFGTFELITSLIVGWSILSEPIRLPEIFGSVLLLTAIIMNRSNHSFDQWRY